MPQTHIISNYTEKENGSKWARKLYPGSVFHKIDIPTVSFDDLDSIARTIFEQISNLKVRVGDRVVIVSKKDVALFAHICVQVLQRRFQETIETIVVQDNVANRIPFVEMRDSSKQDSRFYVGYSYPVGCDSSCGGNCSKC